jgi:N-acetylglutamate synthase-like GNAT family acetyltransferase
MKLKLTVMTFNEYKTETEEFYRACERKAYPEPDDTLIVAQFEEKPIGMVRLCFEQDSFVLRTMQIHPEFQQRGIGTLLLREFDKVLNERNIDLIFCIPYEHLERFYGQIGFKRIKTDEAPDFLRQRLAELMRKSPGEKAILMKRHSIFDKSL